jgi:pyruvate dehydrogenase E2 component (dihydrolipoamide acetyltransferase)
MGDYLMPSLGADMEAGTVIEWRVAPGDTVQRGDIVAVVDTDKADIEVEVFESGVVEELLVPVGQRVPVGTPLARLTPSATASAPAAPAEPALASAAPAEPALASAAPVEPVPAIAPAAPERIRATPGARRLAAERGLDLGGVHGSGPGGAVRAVDLAERPAPEAGPELQPAAPPGPERPDRKQAMRRAVGDLMARSKREIPHYYVASTIDLDRALAWLAERNAARPISARVLPAALLLRATALAVREVPDLNGFWDAGEARVRRADGVHLGVAIALRGGGLVAPAIHDADRLTLDELMEAMRDVVDRARTGRLRSSEMSDPTLTVTNLGEQGADEVYGVIYPPQVALVGFGRIAPRPWAEGGMLGVRQTVQATLAGDHRATDGHTGGRLLAAIDRLLHTPEDL